MANITIQRTFLAPGDFSFTVPQGMTYISIVCCGGGGGSAASGSTDYTAGSLDVDRAVAGNGDAS